MTTSPAERDGNALTKGEALMVANQYIGTDGGYLGRYDRAGGRFSARSLVEFFPEYCNVEVDWTDIDYRETTRLKFVAALLTLSIADQAKVLRGVIRGYPPNSNDDERAKLLPELHRLTARLEKRPLISGGDLKISSEAVRRALEDAETLLREHGPVRAIDRMHTVLHAYLRAACDEASIEYDNLTSVQGLLKKLEREHPKLANLGARPQEVTTILNSLGTIAGALDPIRNNATLAHANTELLGAPEAVLVINTVRAIYFYLDAKLG